MKHPKELFEQERAVSPVVGVALLIAIAVILAAVVGAVVLGLSPGSADAPQASLAFENNTNGELTIIHDGGKTLNEDSIVLRGDIDQETAFNGSGELKTGERVDTGYTLNSGDEVSVVWIDPESGDESVIGSEKF